MVNAVLLTKDGEIVLETSVPSYAPPAEGVLWQSRAFFLDMAKSRAEQVVYVEGMLLTIRDAVAHEDQVLR